MLTANQKSCCSGYCIDLLRLLGDHCNFTYSLHLSFNEYGSLERNNKTGKQDWNGLIGQLVQEYADLIVAPLTINPERAQVMEFSKPFKYQGITILQKRVISARKRNAFIALLKKTMYITATQSFPIGLVFTTIQVNPVGTGFGLRACGSSVLVPSGSFLAFWSIRDARFRPKSRAKRGVAQLHQRHLVCLGCLAQFRHRRRCYL